MRYTGGTLLHDSAAKDTADAHQCLPCPSKKNVQLFHLNSYGVATRTRLSYGVSSTMVALEAALLLMILLGYGPIANEDACAAYIGRGAMPEAQKYEHLNKKKV